MILCFDIDNVVCKTNKTQYKKSTPNLKTIRLINEAYTLGARIILFTGRFYGRCGGNLKKGPGVPIYLAVAVYSVYRL